MTDPKDTTQVLDGRPNERTDLIAADEPIRQDAMNWFVLRVASNKEGMVRETLLRKVQIERMTHLVGRILVPTEKAKVVKQGKMKIQETKLYPGYVFVEMQLEPDGRIPQDVFFLIKETTGVGDFVGTAGRPTPMKDHEITKMLLDSRKPEDEPMVKLTFSKGASLKDPARLFNASLDGNLRRAIDIHEGEEVDAPAFKALVRQAVALNRSGKSKPSKEAKS